MALLTEEQKTMIVLGHARFMRPAEIILMLREEFEIEADRFQVTKLNPERTCYEGGNQWRDLFEQARKQHIEDTATVPIANQGYRLNTLQEGVNAAKKAKNWPLVAQLLEQAAKETGGLLTNQRDVRIDDSRRQRASELTPEDRKMALAEIIRQALEARDAGQLPAPTTIEGKVTP